MAAKRKYVFNNRTLSYEEAKDSRLSGFWRSAILFVASLGMSVLYFWIYNSVLGLETPKQILLQKANDRWCSKIELLNSRMDNYESTLEALALRDDYIYRSIFGMNEISQEVRNAGFGGVNRYQWLDNADHDGLMKSTVMRLDVLTKKAYVQSKSFDEVALLSRRAGDMASCIPAISPVSTDKTKYRLSSSFGYRTDPFTKKSKFHSGVDFAMKPGNPVYATGDGVVESVKFEFFGYGNSVVIDHGFGYKTRYAHLKSISVMEGMTLKRGECIGQTGNSGRSSGPHLHYEVIYKGRQINPYNYYDLTISPEEYQSMVRETEATSEKILHPSHKRQKK